MFGIGRGSWMLPMPRNPFARRRSRKIANHVSNGDPWLFAWTRMALQHAFQRLCFRLRRRLDDTPKVDDGVERRPCVMLQIFDRIKEALGSDVPDRVFIGLSATPFELHDIEAVWTVPQCLTSAYSGFNYFGGRVIDEEADVTPPKTVTFGQFGAEIGLPFLGDISLAAYDAEPDVFDRFAEKTGYAGTQSEYRREIEQTLRAAILYMARNGSGPSTGICNLHSPVQ